MKRILVLIYATFLFGPVLDAQESTPAPPPMEPQAPERPGPWRPTSPAQAPVPVSAPVAPRKPNSPIKKRLIWITSTAVAADYKAPWNAGGLERGVGAGFV